MREAERKAKQTARETSRREEKKKKKKRKRVEGGRRRRRRRRRRASAFIYCRETTKCFHFKDKFGRSCNGGKRGEEKVETHSHSSIDVNVQFESKVSSLPPSRLKERQDMQSSSSAHFFIFPPLPLLFLPLLFKEFVFSLRSLSLSPTHLILCD